MEITLSAIKADVGSIGGHTQPSIEMLQAVQQSLQKNIDSGLLIDGLVTFTGDDIAIICSHQQGLNNEDVHVGFARQAFLAATEVAKEQGNYGAGQDLLVDAPSGNVRGAGPGVAEIEFTLNPKSNYRPAESFMIFAGDKCAPGAFNLPLYLVFCDPMHNGGILLNPKIHLGWVFTVIDMDYKGEDEDRIIQLSVPERSWDVAALLQNPDRYAVESIRSRYKPEEQVVSVSATRLHNIAGKYTGKDDPIAIIRSQGIFPAPEEIIEPYSTINQIISGDARGSHNMPQLPVPINTPVTGPYCHPLISALGFSMNKQGKFAGRYVDFFAGSAWDYARYVSQRRAAEIRRQGFMGIAMAQEAEIAYTGLVDTWKKLDDEFELRKNG
ncbi:fructose 1,6-bisphosphatase [Coxiella burnetii]|uniref:Fructose-1,6-bisphosphate aldolase/phosphatase n=1 Tax=Coxiella burnetii (strain Dugway 5J108-111) TaxID=434922 RepID=A9KCV5_COXBN|nr:CBU_0513 family Dot/Icm type IV secretion system effector [Coxiella burnetii]ABS77982.1 fructose-1,6-bisphosphatase [Coxiella burnetii Dugway 5J108-111]OYK79858.1 fructose 1,6-bisphosphatase [Coxiella burnetii]OYK81940.1 fructose 1,6-bisphosphatase [Coxiella burnetii]